MKSKFPGDLQEAIMYDRYDDQIEKFKILKNNFDPNSMKNLI